VSAEAWSEALDEFEARLLLAEAALELAEEGAAPPFEPPPVEGPIPPECADRARALLARARGVEDRLVASRQRIRAELARMPRLPAVSESRSTLDLQG